MERINRKPFSLLSAADIERLPADVENAYPISVCQSFVCDTIAPRDRMRTTSRHIDKLFNMTKLTEAVQHLTHWHPILRTSFDISNYSERLQLVHRDVEIPILIDQVNAEEAATQEMMKAKEQEVATWNWQNAPLWEVYIQQYDANTWTLHLIETVLDRQSAMRLMNELYSYYCMLIDDQPLPELAPEMAYQTLVATERSMSGSAKAQAFWEENRNQMNETLVLNSFAQSDKDTDGTLRKEEITIAAEVSNALKDAVQKSGTSLETLLFVAHCKVVSLLSGQVAITTGILNDARGSSDNKLEDIGNYVRVLPFALTLGATETWKDIAVRVHEAFAVLEELKKLPITGVNDSKKLFDVMFAYNEQADADYILNTEDEMTIIEDGNDNKLLTVRFISCMNMPEMNGLKCVIEYRDDVVAKEQVIAFGNYYSRVLQSIAGDLTTVHTSSCWLTEEQEGLFLEWNNTDREFPAKNNLAQLFEEQAERTPDRIACKNKNEQLTYRELNERSNQLARYLRKLGVKPEDLVGICMERSNLMLVGLLGILKAGGGYVPLDPKYPKARLDFMLNDAKVEMILTDAVINEQLEFGDRKMIQLENEWATIDTFECDNLECITIPSNVAYLVYTSGSTGFPKAAEIEHRSVIELMYWAKEEFGVETLSGVMAASSICFDMSIFELYTPLSWGGTVIIVDDILQLRDAQASAEISLLSTVPSALSTLAALGWVSNNTKAALLAGEPLSRKTAKTIFKTTKLENIWNAYGLSEDTTYSTVLKIKRGFKEDVTIGRPIANRQLYVLDEYQQRVPLGVIGELYVAGNGLARGYLNRADLTAERFLPNRFDATNKTRMYRTGDLVRYRTDGQLEYIGRKDHQIKLLGHRIDLGEVEMTLATHEAIEQCVVVCREDGGDKRMVGYVVLKNDAVDVTPLLLKDHLKEKLPDWMVPASIVWLEKLPTTSHGKVDRRSLPAPERCPWPTPVK